MCIFPTELICKILSYTSARDVVRWRSISKSFCAIASESEIWKALHATPELLPIPSHERALVKSERLAQSWFQEMAQLRVMSWKEVPYNGQPVGHGSYLIGGRWLIACECNMSFALYDTHANRKEAVGRKLWGAGNIISWSFNSVRFIEGRWVMYMVVNTRNPVQPWILLGLGWYAESGIPCKLIHLNIPHHTAAEHTRYGMENYVSPRSRFMYLEQHSLVFDTISQAFYTFPAFNLALDQTKSRIDATSLQTYHSKITFTNTHMIVLTHSPWKRTGNLFLAQAFSIPDDQHPAQNVVGILRLSHEGVFESRRAAFNVIRNSIVNSNDGSINVRLLGLNSVDCSPYEASCIDLTMHQPSPGSVSSMTIAQHDVIVRSHTPRVDPWICHYSRWDISDEGYARGLATWNSLCEDPDGIQTLKITKFAMDATGDQCVLYFATDRESVLGGGTEIPEIVRCDSARLDGARGKLYYAAWDSMEVADVE